MRTILAKEARDQIVVGTASIGLLVGNHWRTGIRRGQHSRRFRHDPEQRNRENFLDVIDREHLALGDTRRVVARQHQMFLDAAFAFLDLVGLARQQRSEEHTSELQSLMRISYAVFCLKKKKTNHIKKHNRQYTK